MHFKAGESVQMLAAEQHRVTQVDVRTEPRDAVWGRMINSRSAQQEEHGGTVSQHKCCFTTTKVREASENQDLTPTTGNQLSHREYPHVLGFVSQGNRVFRRCESDAKGFNLGCVSVWLRR
ncbi:hypothetical protein CgunFtcFv8_015929 [Champsocephalus gunnari]|uniref:Uncharacterized protein n=1 Tax=Champsocephalus gunnari TaxID=52237 RepID=A0AAN8C7U3_CHAGU|nr:hypothetical protein CgunFtcFv8_015929 [Champsocephalus gunnari]